ncbi:MAG: sugar ABC transporter substrate-binding protein [Sphaerochaetaceae bacterium]|nr:sugar ABC transporter substrate-binding protein [Sphaerochaetaceae bacterium]
MRKLFLVALVLLVALQMGFAKGSSESASESKPQTITLWSGYPEMEPFYKQAAEKFKETHPNVTIEIVSHPLREFEQKLSATIPSNTVADIIEVSVYANQKFIEAGLIPEDEGEVLDFVKADGRFSDFAIANDSYNGKIYGVPLFQGRTALYYNTDMFAEAGITEPPTTFEEMYEDAKKLAKYDSAGNLTRSGHSLRLSGQGSGVAEKFWFVLYPMGGTFIEEGKTAGTYHAAYNNDAGRKALTYYIDAVYKDHWDDQKIKHDAESFELGQTAMFFRESWVIGDIASKAPNLNYATAPVPKDARWGRITNIENLYVTKASKNPDLAWEFVLSLLSEENQRWMFENVGWLPCRNDIDISDIIERHPQFAAFTYTDPDYDEYGYLPIAAFDEVITKLAERLVTAFLDSSLEGNDAAIAKTISDAANETNEILKRYNLYGE